MIVTDCARQSVNSVRVDDVNVLDVRTPVLVEVADIDPPLSHGTVMVRDRPSGETVIAEFIAALLTAAATILSVADALSPEGIAEGADGPCPPHPARRPRTMRHAPDRRARMARHSSRSRIGSAR